MSVRQMTYFAYHRALGHALPSAYRTVSRQDRDGIPPGLVDDALAALLTHCSRHVPYYARLLPNVAPSPREARDALRHLPLLTKDDIRSNAVDLVSDDAARRRTTTTSSGGSTGEPVTLVQDQHHRDWAAAVQLLHTSWTGHRLGQPEVYVWGSERDVVAGTMGSRMTAVNALMRRSYLNAFRMTPQDIRSLIERLNARPPDLIVAYAQSLYEVARFAGESGLAIRPQRAVVVTSETLHGFMRSCIEEAFGCEVFNRYGSREVGDIAGECTEHRGFHVFPWLNYVEILDEDGAPVPDGVDGDIVVTCLTNFAMPLIRYRIGDRGALAPAGSCPCGRRGQMLDRVLGHSGETFRSSDGALVDGGYLSGMMYLREWVQKFQVVQHEFDDIEFKVVLRPRSSAPPEELADIAAKVRRAMGDRCDVRFAFVDAIPPLPSGKFTYTVSYV